MRKGRVSRSEGGRRQNIRELCDSLFLCNVKNFNLVLVFRSAHTHYLFAFLLLVFLILRISCSEVTVLLCYFRLCAEVKTQILMLLKYSKIALLELESSHKGIEINTNFMIFTTWDKFYIILS